MTLKSKRVLIVDYGLGNLMSVRNALEQNGFSVVISDQASALKDVGAVILPGVGAFQKGMKNLEARGLVEPLKKYAQNKDGKVLGICLGMQLLADSSDEDGLCAGLGLIPGHVRLMKPEEKLPLPHVGWNELSVRSDFNPGARFDGQTFYFDHSYALECDTRWVKATVNYGGRYAALVAADNILGVQFHPEKSQAAGLALLGSLLEQTC